MKVKGLQVIDQVTTRICELQTAHVSLQEQFKVAQNNADRDLNDAALRIIDILDLIETVGPNTDASLVIKKIEKRLADILKRWKIQEIIFKDGQIEVGKARVLEARKVTGEMPAGTIIEICRKGYQCANKTIRPAYVITSTV